MDITFPPGTLPWVELQCLGNANHYTDPDLFPVLEPYLPTRPPASCLDLGAGLGRLSVYLCRRLQWSDATFVLVDGDRGGDPIRLSTSSRGAQPGRAP